MGVYGPSNEARGGGFRLTLNAYAKYVFFFTWRVGSRAKFYKRKNFLGIKWWSKHKADSIRLDNRYYKDKYLQEFGESDSKTCNNAKKCELQRGQGVSIGKDPTWKSISSTATAREGSVTLETNADAEFGES